MTSPHYPFLWLEAARLAGAALLGRQLSFQASARRSLARLHPPLKVSGRDCIPRGGPCLITANHYSRPGFRAWWLTLAISAVFPVEIHWVITAAWTFPGRRGAPLLTPISSWLLRRVAAVYSFTTMPPMPPRPEDAASRARAVRQVLAYARQANRPVIGLAPEGGDSESGMLQQPPLGAGRFMLHLAELGLPVLPTGVYEENGCLSLRFGPPYRLLVPDGLTPEERDLLASQEVMQHIASLIPSPLRGEFR